MFAFHFHCVRSVSNLVLTSYVFFLFIFVECRIGRQGNRRMRRERESERELGEREREKSCCIGCRGRLRERERDTGE